MRSYAATLGRWLTPDPAGLAAVDPNNPQSWNRYAYVLNNPVALADPFGLWGTRTCPRGTTEIFTSAGSVCADGGNVFGGTSLSQFTGSIGGSAVDTGANGLLATTLAKLSPACAKKLAPYMGKLETAVTDLVFLNGSALAGSLPAIGKVRGGILDNLYPSDLPGGPAPSLHAYQLHQHSGSQLAGAVLGTKYVVLYPNYYSAPMAQGTVFNSSQAEVVLHEALHLATGLDDEGLAKFLTGHSDGDAEQQESNFLRSCVQW